MVKGGRMLGGEVMVKVNRGCCVVMVEEKRYFNDYINI